MKEESNLFGKEKDYGPSFKEHLFQQYKFYLESAEKISDRRQVANAFFLTLNTAFISFIGFLVTQTDFTSFLFRLLIAVVGVAICLVWLFLINSYKQLNSVKFKVIHKIEEKLPLKLYDYEWDRLGEGKDNSKYFPFSHAEIYIPWIFGFLYVLILFFR